MSARTMHRKTSRSGGAIRRSGRSELARGRASLLQGQLQGQLLAMPSSHRPARRTSNDSGEVRAMTEEVARLAERVLEVQTRLEVLLQQRSG